jgi:hypothetical protein
MTSIGDDYTIPKYIPKIADRGLQCMFLGYLKDLDGDCYQGCAKIYCIDNIILQQIERSAIRIITSALTRNENIKDAYVRASAKTNMPFPPTLEKCISELRELSRSITNLEKEGAQLRQAEQKTHLSRCLQQKDRAGAKAIRQIMNA